MQLLHGFKYTASVPALQRAANRLSAVDFSMIRYASSLTAA
jgi:hypothetical protein